MHTGKATTIPALLLLILLISGCAKWEDLSWETAISTPLLKTRIDITDIIPDSFLSGDCQNWAYIDYNQEVFRFRQDTLFNLSDPLSSLSFTIPATVTLQPGQSFINTNETTKFSFSGAEITSIRLSKGLVAMKMTNPLPQPVVCHYSLPGSDKDGKPFSVRVVVPAASGGVKGMIEWDADISGYTVNLNGANGVSVNTIHIKIEAIVDSSAQAVQVTPFYTLTIDAKFEELLLEEAYGYFGHHLVEPAFQTVHIKSFEFFSSGKLQTDTAVGAFTISNGSGMDLSVKLKKLIARNTRNNETFVVPDPFISTPVNIGRAAMDPTTGIITPTEHRFVFSHATMKELLELLPDKLDYEISFEINPLGNVSSGNDFLKASSPLKVDFELFVPLAFDAEGLTISQDADFDLGDINISEGKLFVIADNRFPFDATMVLRMKDEQGVIIDSLVPAGIILAGFLELPDLIRPIRSILTIPCDTDRMERLARTRKVSLDVILDTRPAGTLVRLKNDYDMQLVISANIHTTLAP
ncbi:MAG: hypothetical protein R6V49_00680 [Bacteroidales bacterium]